MSIVVNLPCYPCDVPDSALLFFNESTNEYYVITDNFGNILTWSS